MKIRILIALVLLLAAANFAFAQTTEFTYQGRLVDGSMPANASYDFEFKLFDVETGGIKIGTQTRLGVPVANGIFTVRLDFGAEGFRGSPRFLEIFVKPAGGPTFTVLTPRQPVTSAPHAIKSLSADTAQSANFATNAADATNAVNATNATNAVNATNATNAATATNSLQLGGVAANQYVITTDSRMTDARNPLPNSGNYVQNTTTPQATSNFNIAGNGTAGGTLSGNAVNSTTQYNIGGSRVLTTSSFFLNIFAGIGAGTANTTGSDNSFFGQGAGQSNVTGGANPFFGRNAGNSNTAGNNSFFGEQSGFGTSTGGQNSFFGQNSGRNNGTGSDNAFFGFRAGQNNTASGNSFFGSGAGDSVTTGQWNSFFGRSAGAAVITGSGNSFFGYNAGTLSTAINNTFFGAFAGAANVTGGGNAFFGKSAGLNNTASGNSFFGGNAGLSTTSGGDNAFFGENAGFSNTTGIDNAYFGKLAGDNNTNGSFNSFFGSGAGRLTDASGVFLGGAGNSFFGASAGEQNSTGSHNVFIGDRAGEANTTGSFNTVVGSLADVGSSFLTYATAIGAGAVVNTNQTVVLGRASDSVRIPGDAFIDGGANFVGEANFNYLAVNQLGTAGSTSLCRNGVNRISACSSSLRYKTGVQSFFGGLDVVRRLRPITFNWKDGGMSDVGFAAEEVEKIEPLLTTYNDKGEIEGVKYGQITTVLVNAVNEQQAQIEEQKQQIKKQQEQIERQQKQTDALKKLVCQQNPQADACKEK